MENGFQRQVDGEATSHLFSGWKNSFPVLQYSSFFQVRWSNWVVCSLLALREAEKVVAWGDKEKGFAKGCWATS